LHSEDTLVAEPSPEPKDRPKDSQPAPQITHGSVDLKIITESEDVESDVREDVASILPLIMPSKPVKAITDEIIKMTMATINKGFDDLERKDVCPILSDEEL
ncbi:hypothetical protein EV175_005831, partial [Coemansia sp. RSA 1933]